MPKRDNESCLTCRWSIKAGADTMVCRKRTTINQYDYLLSGVITSESFWCSEWEPVWPETCKQCFWFDEQYSNCTHSMGPTKHVYVATGACDNIRRVE